MRDRIRSFLPLLLAAVLGSALTAGGPALATAAFDAMNAHKVDGKHAVGAGASPQARAGKLVATNGAGRLPNNIIAKAGNADRLDGRNSTAYIAGARSTTNFNSVPVGGCNTATLASYPVRLARASRILGTGTSRYTRVQVGPTPTLRLELVNRGGAIVAHGSITQGLANEGAIHTTEVLSSDTGSNRVPPGRYRLRLQGTNYGNCDGTATYNTAVLSHLALTAAK